MRPPLALAAVVLAAVAIQPALATAKAPYTATPGAEQANPSFTVSYEGKGSYRTRFHAHPPNPGEKDDTNDGRDSSRQAWDIKFLKALAFPACGPPADGSADPCESVTPLNGARGPTSMSGRVNHKHVDGIYREFDRTVKCRLHVRPSPRRRLEAALAVRYLPESQSFALRAESPLVTTATLFPGQCPKQGEAIDRIANFYAMPGFSFAQGFGPERWFTSREVVIPASVLHGSSKITIPLRNTPAGTPPPHCAVQNPEYERCTTGGSWSGVLTLKRRAAGGAGVAAARAAKVKRPIGMFTGRPGKIEIYAGNRSLDLFAFSVKCGDGSARAGLNAIQLKKTRRGYRFAIKANASFTYSDGHPDQNGSVSLSGRFSRTGKSVKGVLRAKTPHCGDSGRVEWRAAR